MSPDSSAPILDTVFDLLSNQRRRYVISCLHEHGSMKLPDLAEEVASRENDAPLTEIPAEEVTRVYMSLWHSHVPRLADAGVVEYSQERETVAFDEDVGRLKRLVTFHVTESPMAGDGG